MRDAREKLIAVTVTYGRRWNHLRPVLAALESEAGVDEVVVVDNGSSVSIDEEANRAGFSKHTVITLPRNRGSATGFRIGIETAINRRAAWVWLLDDDNQPRDDTLHVLSQEYAEQRNCAAADGLAVLAYRPNHQFDVATEGSGRRLNKRRDSFHGFHLIDLPHKIWRRRSWARQPATRNMAQTLQLDEAPYSGLLFRRELVEAIGFPNDEFVLYSDDSEFTSRITRNGGRIVLVTKAVLDDLEMSWNVERRFETSIAGILRGRDAFRAYYSMRNGAYLDLTTRKHNGAIFALNRFIYMTLLRVGAWMYRTPERYDVVRQAVKDGLRGRLGMNKRFPL